MNDLALAPTIQSLLVFGGLLFTAGLLGFLTRRSMILLFLSLELMLAGVSINLIAFGRLHGNIQGQVFAIMILTVAACEAAIALAMVTSLYRRKATLDIRSWSMLSDYDYQPEVESAEPLPPQRAELPHLSPAGHDPAVRPVRSEGEPGWNRSGAAADEMTGAGGRV